jgi:hypothetical protein
MEVVDAEGVPDLVFVADGDAVGSTAESFNPYFVGGRDYSQESGFAKEYPQKSSQQTRFTENYPQKL